MQHIVLTTEARRAQRDVSFFVCRRPTINLYDPIGHPVLAGEPRRPAVRASGKQKSTSINWDIPMETEEQNLSFHGAFCEDDMLKTLA